VNEVTTGIGRTGTWFGYQHYGIAPDIVAMGKGIGNGYPVSATTFAPRVMRRLGGRPVMFAQSHQNDPLGAAVAREVIRTIREENLLERGKTIAATMRIGLERIQSRFDRIRQVRGRGLMLALEIRDDADTSFTIQLHRELVRRGFLLARRPGAAVLRLDPGLTIEAGDIGDFLEVLEEALEKALAEEQSGAGAEQDSQGPPGGPATG
jgi:acetylornithine aminotransferase